MATEQYAQPGKPRAPCPHTPLSGHQAEAQCVLTCVVQEVGVGWVHALLQPECVINRQLTHCPLHAAASLHA